RRGARWSSPRISAFRPCLFLYCSGDPPDSPSFPTRRSSDLPFSPLGALGPEAAASPSAAAEPASCPAPPPSSLPRAPVSWASTRSEEHTSELQSRFDLVCRLLLEKKKPQRAAPKTETRCHTP